MRNCCGLKTNQRKKRVFPASTTGSLGNGDPILRLIGGDGLAAAVKKCGWFLTTLSQRCWRHLEAPRGIWSFTDFELIRPRVSRLCLLCSEGLPFLPTTVFPYFRTPGAFSLRQLVVFQFSGENMRSAKGARWASRTTYLSPGVRNCGWTLRSSAGRPRMSGAWAPWMWKFHELSICQDLASRG